MPEPLGKVIDLPDRQHLRKLSALHGIDDVIIQAERYLQLFSRMALAPDVRDELNLQNTMLLYGPPGVGKTVLAHGLASLHAKRTGAHSGLFEFAPDRQASDLKGGTSKNVRRLCRFIRDMAGKYAVFYVVMNECESNFGNRLDVNPSIEPLDTMRGIEAWLDGLDQIKKDCANALIVMSTNQPGRIDPALRDRIDLSIAVRPPLADGREQILRDTVRGAARVLNVHEHLLDDACLPDWQRVVQMTDGYSGRALKRLIVNSLTNKKSSEPLTMDVILKTAANLLEHDMAHGDGPETCLRPRSPRL